MMSDDLIRYSADSLLNKKFTKRDFLSTGICLACSFLPGTKLFGVDEFTGDLWKWSKEAKYYTKEGKTCYCDLCDHLCIIRPDRAGDCRVRANVDGKLYTLVYGNPCAVHVDPIEKKPLFHFLPATRSFSIATAGCNLRCLNCQNWSISQAKPQETRNYDLMPENVVSSAKKYKCDSIAYTYSEPIVFYEYTYDSAKLAKEQGIKNLLISAGFIKEKPLRKLCGVIDAANIDLKSFDDETYVKLNGCHLKPILESLKIIKEMGVWLEITNLIVPNWTDNMNKINEMCRWLVKNGFENYPLHFSRFTPLYKLAHLPPTPASNLHKARRIALDAGMKYVYIGNLPGTDAENTYCPSCGKIVIKRQGFSISENNVNNGKCKFCSEKIHGVWN